jgi:purine-nucleoside phosphorylase
MEEDGSFSPGSDVYVEATEAATHLRDSLPQELRNPSIAIICGSGLGGLADTLQDRPRFEISNESVPHLSSPTGMLYASHRLCLLSNGRAVEGHEGKLVFGVLGKRQVPAVLMVGRLQSGQ